MLQSLTLKSSAIFESLYSRDLHSLSTCIVTIRSHSHAVKLMFRGDKRSQRGAVLQGIFDSDSWWWYDQPDSEDTASGHYHCGSPPSYDNSFRIQMLCVQLAKDAPRRHANILQQAVRKIQL